MIEDIKRVVVFISNYAEKNALLLPGRVSSHHRDDIQLLPSSSSKADVFKLYEDAMNEAGFRVVAASTFRSLWLKLMPRVVMTRPMTDLCVECQRNNRAISASSNLPEVVKAAKLEKQQRHLTLVREERALYQQQVQQCKEQARDAVLGPHIPCSNSTPMHYSFDFAQQVHIPHDPMQPGPMYFMCPRKVGIFGVCCEGIPQQVNYLIDEANSTSKGSEAVISYLHHFFERYGLGEKEVNLHCDNCAGQNKNNFVLAYLMWRVLTGRHEKISLHFMMSGHTKFGPDWCFGLLKRKFRRTPVSSLQQLSQCVEGSSKVNLAQLVGTENGDTLVPVSPWQPLLTSIMTPLKGISGHHHFVFDKQSPGTVTYKTNITSEEATHRMLKVPVNRVPHDPPPPVAAPGLSAQRQWYLFDNIRDYCTEGTQDLLCPRPNMDRPQANQPTPSTSTELSSEEPMGGGRGRGRGRAASSSVASLTSRGRGRGRAASSSATSQTSRGRGRGRAAHDVTPERGRGRGSGRGRANATTVATRSDTAESTSALRARGRPRGRPRGQTRRH